MAKTLDIGKVDRSLFVFGGVYSNYEALVAAKKLAESRGFRPKDIICTGDVVGYCAEPAACVDFMEQWGVYCIAGNVELNLRNEADDCGCNFSEGSRCDVFSRQWYPYAKQHVTDKNLEYIQQLPEFIDFEFYGVTSKVVHGSFFNTSEFLFSSSSDERFDGNFEGASCELIVAGHCGLPFEKKTEKGHWINAGVIGMPANDGTTRTWCGILGSSPKGIHFEYIPILYDHQSASNKMKAAGLPKSYADTLDTGIWDNCEILPERETLQQGKAIHF